MGCLQTLLFIKLLDGLVQARFDRRIDTAVLRLDTAATRQQTVVLKDPPLLGMPFTQRLDQFEILRIDIQGDVAGAHWQ